MLNAKAFTEFLGNCTPAQLEDRFVELGITGPFSDTIGGVPELKSHFGGGGVRDVSKKTREKLESLIERRNRLVHAASISETVLVDEVLTSAEFARAFLCGVKAVVRAA